MAVILRSMDVSRWSLAVEALTAREVEINSNEPTATALITNHSIHSAQFM
jgi:hypothetical protein